MPKESEEKYVITPKGIATLAMLRTGLIQSTNDPRFEGVLAVIRK